MTAFSRAWPAEHLPPAERLQVFDELKTRVHKEFAHLDTALGQGYITLDEYRFYLKQVYDGKDEREVMDLIRREEATIRESISAARGSKMPAAAAFMIFLVLTGLAGVILVLNPGQGITGFVTYDATEEVSVPVDLLFTEQGNASLNITNVTGLKASGILTDGSASVYLRFADQRLLVWEGETSVPVYSVRTDKESYALNSTVNVTVTPANVSYTLWLTDEAGEKTLVQEQFVTTTPGDFVLDALINDTGNVTKVSTSFTVRNDTNASNDVLREEEAAQLAFAATCVDSCAFNQTNETLLLDVELSEGSRLEISEVISVHERANNAPAMTQELPDIELRIGEHVEIELLDYFEDPDGDMITFDFMNVGGVDITLDESTLFIEGLEAGIGQSIVYASDLYELSQSNLFTITVLGSNTSNVTNSTNTTQNNTNSTVVTPPVVINDTNMTVNETLDCSNPDPNARPIECLQQESPVYFPPQAIYITTTGRTPIARITPIGNLLLTGEVHEQASFTANTRDYVIGYENEFGRFTPTIWFDSDTGNLYLTGRLYEERISEVPPPGSYALRNRKGITLAWANQGRGDLYVRGNVIPYRTTIIE